MVTVPAHIARWATFRPSPWARLAAMVKAHEYVTIEGAGAMDVFIELRHTCTPWGQAAPVIVTCVNEGACISYAHAGLRVIYNADRACLYIAKDMGYCGEDR